MTEQERDRIRDQYNRLMRIERLEAEIERLKETKRALTATQGNFTVDWSYTLDHMPKWGGDSKQQITETFNHTLTRVEFLDLLKRTVSGYLDKKIAEYEAEIERI